MKHSKLFLIFLGLNLSSFCMEVGEPHPKKVKKDPDIKALYLDVKREKTIIPQGLVGKSKAFINLKEKESLTQSTFKELIEDKAKQGLPFILATVMTKGDTRTYNFYSAPELNTHLFNGYSNSNNRYSQAPALFKDPMNKQTILGEIFYFIIKKLGGKFKYLGSDYDLLIGSENKKQFLRTFFQANQGDAEARNNLACFYTEGFGVEKDLYKAAKLYKLSADQGNAIAQYNLAICYTDDFGVEKDLNKAFRLFKLSANQGLAVAQCNLAVCYENGLGVEKDLNEALRLYKLSADQGDVNAQKKLKKL